MFAAFKAGVQREVGAGDTEAHFDLGIAYKEMGLLDDAIGEFRVAMVDAARRLACLHMMAVCALDLGRGADAVAHLSEALAGGVLPRDQEAALRLDLGRAHQANGDRARARTEYEAVRALAPDFADVERFLAELDTAAAEPAQSEGEAFESFDDLISDDPRSALAEPPAAPQYESFDELISDDAELAPAALGEAAGPAAPAPPEPDAEAEITLTEVALAPPQPEPGPTPPAPPAEAPRSREPAPAARRKQKISFV